MAKTESTAVNDLIKIAATQTPLRQDPSDDLMFTAPPKKDRSTKHSALAPRGTDVPLPRDRAPQSTQQNAIAMPRAASPSLASIEPIATRTTRPSLPPPTRAPALPPARAPLPSEYPVVSAEPVWADDSLDIDVGPFRGDSTAQVVKPRTTLEWMIKLAPLAGAMILLGAIIGGYLVFARQDGTSAAAQPAAAPSTVEVAAAETAVAADPAKDVPETAAAATPTVASTAPSAPSLPESAAPTTPSITAPAPSAAALGRRPVLVDVRIDSKPPGATVTLVDRGKQTFLGTTPISTAVDPSRGYDVVFAHPRRPTQTVHLDPKAAIRLAVVLGRTGTPSIANELAKPIAVAPAAKVVAAAPKIAKPAPAGIAEPAWDAPIEKAVKVEKAAAPAAAPAAGGTGTLMISSKPPCEIHVDGKPTGLMTPQRALSLAAGKHKITLVNPTQKIKKSVAVEITANESTKVIQDLTELMK